MPGVNPGGKLTPVLICILAISLGFHAITLEGSTFTRKPPNLKSGHCSGIALFFVSLGIYGGRTCGNRQTHEQVA